jgi:hypothetical protein
VFEYSACWEKNTPNQQLKKYFQKKKILSRSLIKYDGGIDAVTGST